MKNASGGFVVLVLVQRALDGFRVGTNLKRLCASAKRAIHGGMDRTHAACELSSSK